MGHRIKNLSLKTKLVATAILISCGILVLMGTMGFTTERIKVTGPVYQEIAQGKDLVADILPPPEYIIESYLVVLQAMAEKDGSRIPSFQERLKKLHGEYDDRHAYWGKELPEGKIKSLLQEQSYKPAMAFYDTAEKTFLPALASNNHERAEKLLHDVLSPAYEAHRKVIDEVVTLSNSDNANTEKRASAMLGTSKIIVITLGLILFAAVLAIFFFIIRNITRQLGGDPSHVAEIARQVADGNLSINIHNFGGSDSVLGAMEEMVDNLHTIISQVSGTSAQTAVSAHQLHSVAERIASGTDDVAAQTGTIATAGEEMSSTSGDIARNCQLAAEGAQRASQSAQNGSAVVEKTVMVMSQIAEKVQESARTVESLGARSDQIGDIIGTIEDIADQTNLLALNAAIEAARAGDQGRGFAVVADEVRALAERTTRATREIGEMIKAIQSETRGAVAAMEQGVRQVESGTMEAAHSGEALRDIMEQVNSVAMQVSQIATAAEEQTATTGEISNNMHQITEIIRATAHGAQESATAASLMNGYAEELTTILGKFKLDEDVPLSISKAKSAHMIFIGKIKAHLDGSARIDPNQLPTHLTCAFGKWCQGKGQEACGHLGHFREIDTPHARVHELGKQAVNTFNSGDRNKAMQMCAEMVSSSEALLGILDQLALNYKESKNSKGTLARHS